MSHRNRTWEDLGDHAEDHRRDRHEKAPATPTFEVDDTVRVSEHSALAAAGYTGIVADVDPGNEHDDQTTCLVKLSDPNAPPYPGGWWIDELELFHHDCDQEDDGA